MPAKLDASHLCNIGRCDICTMSRTASGRCGGRKEGREGWGGQEGQEAADRGRLWIPVSKHSQPRTPMPGRRDAASASSQSSPSWHLSGFERLKAAKRSLEAPVLCQSVTAMNDAPLTCFDWDKTLDSAGAPDNRATRFTLGKLPMKGKHEPDRCNKGNRDFPGMHPRKPSDEM